MTKGRKRTQKWYLKNEEEVMRELGLTPTKGSGSGWVEKEDGYNDHILCQLKSTDKESYRIKQLDIEKLEYNAIVSRKTPVFIIQFLNKDTRYALMAIEDIPTIAEYMKTGKTRKDTDSPIVFVEDGTTLDEVGVKRVERHEMKVKSSSKAREAFYKAKAEEWEQRKRR